MSDFCRIEHLAEDYVRIAKKLHLTHRTIPHLNRSDRGNETRFYDDEGIELVATIYRDDLTRFGYVRPSGGR